MVCEPAIWEIGVRRPDVRSRAQRRERVLLFNFPVGAAPGQHSGVNDQIWVVSHNFHQRRAGADGDVSKWAPMTATESRLTGVSAIM
jgi:hypothetical protein